MILKRVLNKVGHHPQLRNHIRPSIFPQRAAAVYGGGHSNSFQFASSTTLTGSRPRRQLSSSVVSNTLFQGQGSHNRSFSSQIVKVTLPDLGEGTKEATIKEWYVQPGQKVAEYDDLVEVFTDKLVAKIPSTADGVVKDITLEIDEVCLVGHTLLTIEVEEEDAAAVPATQPIQQQQQQNVQKSQEVEETASPQLELDLNAKKTAEQKMAEAGPGYQSKALSTPAVRHLAKANGLDINEIRGTGKHGRVTKEDVIYYMQGQGSPIANSVQQEETVKQMSSHSTQQAPSKMPQVIQPPLTGVTKEDKVKKIVGMKKAMTKTMTQSLTVPTFTFSDDMDATQLLQLRNSLKNQVEGGVSVLAFFLKGLSLAMTEFPHINSIVDPELDEEGYIKQYVIKQDHNFSVAIDSSDGLTTPNIKKVQTKSILDINNDLKDLINRSNQGKLISDDFNNGTFAVSSVGNIGGKYFVPTILRPSAAIIAIGKAHKVPKYTEGADMMWTPIDCVSFSITADHRIIDGASVARFSQKFKQYVENPNLMLISI